MIYRYFNLFLPVLSTTCWGIIDWDNSSAPNRHRAIPWCNDGPVRWCALLWRHYERDIVSNHQRLYCSLNRWFRRRSKMTLKLGVTGLCVGNSPVTGEFPAQRASNAENVSIWWRHHGICLTKAEYLCIVLDPINKVSASERKRCVCNVFLLWGRCWQDIEIGLWVPSVKRQLEWTTWHR